MFPRLAISLAVAFSACGNCRNVSASNGPHEPSDCGEILAECSASDCSSLDPRPILIHFVPDDGIAPASIAESLARGLDVRVQKIEQTETVSGGRVVVVFVSGSVVSGHLFLSLPGRLMTSIQTGDSLTIRGQYDTLECGSGAAATAAVFAITSSDGAKRWKQQAYVVSDAGVHVLDVGPNELSVASMVVSPTCAPPGRASVGIRTPLDGVQTVCAPWTGTLDGGLGPECVFVRGGLTLQEVDGCREGVVDFTTLSFWVIDRDAG